MCDAIQYSDQMQCVCGLAWDVNDPEPPICSKVAARRREQVNQSTAESYQISVAARRRERMIGRVLRPKPTEPPIIIDYVEPHTRIEKLKALFDDTTE